MVRGDASYRLFQQIQPDTNFLKQVIRDFFNSNNFLTDNAKFYFSLDNENWTQLGAEFYMIYNLVHFMGNRFAIYNYATKTAGGYVDIDFFNYASRLT
ncbi:MAG: hypothetical protein LBG28_12285, partial [Tannerella sp.]|nr:hypothetical protein [Tannerella sp.]